MNISSGSYMFDAELKDNGDVTDVELNRKEFEEIVDDKELADFLRRITDCIITKSCLMS